MPRMLNSVVPKLPMRDKQITRNYYIDLLGFEPAGTADHPGYLMVKRDNIELHFFEHSTLDPHENYGQVYIRTNDIEKVYSAIKSKGVGIHPNGALEIKPWGQKEFSLLDPDNNLLTFGEGV